MSGSRMNCPAVGLVIAANSRCRRNGSRGEMEVALARGKRCCTPPKESHVGVADGLSIATGIDVPVLETTASAKAFKRYVECATKHANVPRTCARVGWPGWCHDICFSVGSASRVIVVIP